MFSATQLVHSMTRSGAHPSKPVELQPGQVVKGTVMKLYPDNMALVQIGGMQVQAKLETNLEPGQKAWLQVQPSTGVVTLKVLTVPGEPTEAQDATLEGLLRTLGVADTKENRSIVQALLQANLPVGKELVRAFAAISKSLGKVDQATVDAFLFAVKRGLPLTADTVGGIQTFLSDRPLSQAIQSFLQHATLFLAKEAPQSERQQASPSTGMPAQIAPQMDTEADGQITPVRQIVSQLAEKVSKLPLALPEIAVMDDTTDLATASMRPTAPVQVSAGVASTAISDLTTSSPQQAASSSKIPSEDNAPSQTSHTVGGKPIIAQTNPSPAAKFTSQLTNEAPEQQQTGSQGHTLPDVLQSSPETGKNSGQVRLENHSMALPNIDSEQLQQPQADRRVMSSGSKGADQPAPEHAPVPTMEGTVPKPAESHQMNGTKTNPIQDLFRALGLTHERSILEQGMSAHLSDAGKQLESVKSLLLQLTQSPAHSMPVGLREAADTLLQHVTGQQLMLVQPTSQNIAQFVMQIPLRTQQGEETAYVQIESKKRAGGQLDPENCRLFFNLQLQMIGTTMVDVTIVNRIVNIQVYNDTPWVEAVAHQMRDGLAEQLREVGYQLSSMRVQPSAVTSDKTGRLAAKTNLFTDYKGVDIRI